MIDKSSSATLAQEIDALLPQTQCGQCGYLGCQPYAKAVAEQGETIDRCLPGGVKVLQAIAQLLNQDAEPWLASMAAKAQPPSTVKIRADECIGCTKCLQVCPVDAIIGSTKQLHVVLTAECTGCGLCLAPCPVDCIDQFWLSQPLYQPERARQRFEGRQQRLKKNQQDKPMNPPGSTLGQELTYVEAAVARVEHKRSLLTQKASCLQDKA